MSGHKLTTTIDRNSPLARFKPAVKCPPQTVIVRQPVYVPGPAGPAGPDGAPGSGTEKVQSTSGAFTVPALAAVNDLLYSTGGFTADRASNATAVTAPAIGVIISKPTATTATVVFWGPVDGFVGLTPGITYYLGVDGAIVDGGSVPTAAGSILQRVGVALDATTLLFNPGITIVRG